jgi:hypothetical protein
MGPIVVVVVVLVFARDVFEYMKLWWDFVNMDVWIHK